MKKIALFAGNGSLPKDIIKKSNELNDKCFLIGLNGLSPESLNDVSNEINWLQVGHVKNVLEFLREREITHIIFAGGMKRPSISELKLDMLGIKWVKDMGLSVFGDDGLLTGITKKLENEGFEILSPKEYLSDVLLKTGSYNPNYKIKSDDLNFVKHGFKVLDEISKFDIGQSLVINEGSIVGIEAMEGTANLINRCGNLKKGSILIKSAKKGQNESVDFPTIGPDTITQLYVSDFKGVVLRENKCQIIDIENTIKKLTNTDLFFEII